MVELTHWKKGIKNMKRIIKFTKKNGNYVFKEQDTEKKLLISEEEKKIMGTEIYELFFKDYSIDDEFEFTDESTDEDKKSDKLCNQVYIKIKELFDMIEKNIKTSSVGEKYYEHKKD